jgi:hypothetical protein
MLIYRGSMEAVEFINKKLEGKREGKKVKGIGNESDEKSKKEIE